MISLKNVRYFSNLTCKSVSLLNVSNSLNGTVGKVKPAQLVIKRNASIHTRGFWIQKLKLEHINNWGIALIVSEYHWFHRFAKTFFLTIYSQFLKAFPISCFGLGAWQIKRKLWKESLIAEMKDKVNRKPIDLPDE